MLKNDFEKLNSDDWLAKEIAREKAVSAWDMDDASKLRSEHEDDCDAKNLAREHTQVHNPVNIKDDNRYGWFLLDFSALILLMFFHSFLRFGFPDFTLYFLGIMLFNPVALVFMFSRKKLLPALYYKIVLLVGAATEAAWLYIFFSHTLY